MLADGEKMADRNTRGSRTEGSNVGVR